MENAADALKMAAFALIFVLALSSAMYTLSKAKAVSDVVLENSNSRSFYSYVDEDSYIDSPTSFKTERIVTFDSIVPTLYRYYKENYTVEFYDKNNNPINLYRTNDGEYTNKLDIDEEMNRNEYWQGSPQSTKEHLDTIIYGTKNGIKSELWRNYKDSSFKEELGIIDSDDENLQELDKQTKRVIRYTVI